jgi:hypothetical protein
MNEYFRRPREQSFLKAENSKVVRRFADRLEAEVYMRVFFLVVFFVCRSASALAVESQDLPHSPGIGDHSTLAPRPDGRMNITEEWKNSGAARLYWNTLMMPRQIQMGGATFHDPALVPELSPGGRPVPSERKNNSKTPVKVQTSAKTRSQQSTIDSGAAAIPQRPPANAGSTALKPPVPPQDNSKIPPLNTIQNAVAGSGEFATINQPSPDAPKSEIAVPQILLPNSQP